MAENHDAVRLKIVTLYKHAEMTVMEIAKELDISHSTVSRTIRRFQETGSHTTKYENCGRPPSFDERDIRRMRHIASKDPRKSAGEIQKELGATGECSLRTVQRTLTKVGIKAVKPYRRPFISEKQAAQRLQWARHHRHWTVDDWSNVIFSDESVFAILDNCPCYVRVIEGHPLTPAHYNLTRKHPSSVMVWACFSIRGAGRAAIIDGTMNTEKYCDQIIEHRVIAQLNEWFPEGSGLFQQDNAPCHKSKRTMDFMAAKGINVLPWPPASPDLNPIENLWSIVKRRLRERSCTSKQTIISNFISIWNRDPEIVDNCRKLVESMPSRIEAVIAAKGFQTRY